MCKTDINPDDIQGRLDGLTLIAANLAKEICTIRAQLSNESEILARDRLVKRIEDFLPSLVSIAEIVEQPKRSAGLKSQIALFAGWARNHSKLKASE